MNYRGELAAGSGSQSRKAVAVQLEFCCVLRTFLRGWGGGVMGLAHRGPRAG